MRVCIFLLDRQKRHQQLRLPVSLADKIGLKLSAKACFDPTAAPSCDSRLRFCSVVLTLALHRMFKRLGALKKSSGLNVSFLNTHPASDERVKVCTTSHHGLVIYHSLVLLLPKSNLRLYFQRHSLYGVLCVVGCQII